MVLDERFEIPYDFLFFGPFTRLHKRLGQLTCTLWNNLMIFLTPWFKWRRVMLGSFANRNDGKPITWNRKSVWLSPFGGGPCYLLKTGLFGASLFRVTETDADRLEVSIYLRVCHKPFCITKRQCQEFLHEAALQTSRYDGMQWW